MHVDLWLHHALNTHDTTADYYRNTFASLLSTRATHRTFQLSPGSAADVCGQVHAQKYCKHQYLSPVIEHPIKAAAPSKPRRWLNRQNPDQLRTLLPSVVDIHYDHSAQALILVSRVSSRTADVPRALPDRLYTMVEPPPDPKRQRLDEEEVLDEAEAPEEAEDGQGEEVDPAAYGVDQETYQAYLNQQAVLDQVRGSTPSVAGPCFDLATAGMANAFFDTHRVPKKHHHGCDDLQGCGVGMWPWDVHTQQQYCSLPVLLLRMMHRSAPPKSQQESVSEQHYGAV